MGNKEKSRTIILFSKKQFFFLFIARNGKVQQNQMMRELVTSSELRDTEKWQIERHKYSYIGFYYRSTEVEDRYCEQFMLCFQNFLGYSTDNEPHNRFSLVMLTSDRQLFLLLYLISVHLTKVAISLLLNSEFCTNFARKFAWFYYENITSSYMSQVLPFNFAVPETAFKSFHTVVRQNKNNYQVDPPKC